MNNTIFSPQGLEEYIGWQSEDRKTLKRINGLLQSIHRDGALGGIGKPEKLKYTAGYSRRIDGANRLIYEIDAQGNLIIVSCKGHYEDSKLS
jgi:toxin YoeB